MSDLISRQGAIDVVDAICERCGKYKEYNGVMCGTCALDGVEDSIEDLPSAEPQWIPVSERMPDEPFGCLVTVEDEEPMTGALFTNILPYFVGWDGEQWNDADGEQCPFEVLAWMPLPKPYEGDI